MAYINFLDVADRFVTGGSKLHYSMYTTIGEGKSLEFKIYKLDDRTTVVDSWILKTDHGGNIIGKTYKIDSSKITSGYYELTTSISGTEYAKAFISSYATVIIDRLFSFI